MVHEECARFICTASIPICRLRRTPVKGTRERICMREQGRRFPPEEGVLLCRLV